MNSLIKSKTGKTIGSFSYSRHCLFLKFRVQILASNAFLNCFWRRMKQIINYFQTINKQPFTNNVETFFKSSSLVRISEMG